MTRQEKQEILNSKTIATYYDSLYSGFELKRFQHGIIDVATGVWRAANKLTVHQVSVNYTSNGDAYIRINGKRIKTSEMLRVQQKIFPTSIT